MSKLKLEKLPNREAAKITFTASAELSEALIDYQRIYERIYGQKEAVSDLIPFMLTAFMNTDQAFKTMRKNLEGKTLRYMEPNRI